MENIDNQSDDLTASFFFSELMGKKCWSVIGGGATGSMLYFHIGRQMARDKPLRNPTLTETERKFTGEFSIFIQNAHWEIFRAAESIADCTDDNNPGGRMLSGVDLLIGNEVIDYRYSSDSSNFTVSFLHGFSLVVYCDDICTDATCYSLIKNDEHVFKATCKPLKF